jgi:hypothetical protein
MGGGKASLLKGTADGSLRHLNRVVTGGSPGAPSGISPKDQPVFLGQAINVFAIFTLSVMLFQKGRLPKAGKFHPGRSTPFHVASQQIWPP